MLHKRTENVPERDSNKIITESVERYCPVINLQRLSNWRLREMSGEESLASTAYMGREFKRKEEQVFVMCEIDIVYFE